MTVVMNNRRQMIAGKKNLPLREGFPSAGPRAE
jgi:hypothetical protein